MSKEGIGISNLNMTKIIKNSSSSDLESNFAGVSSSDKINLFGQLSQSNQKNRLKVSFYNLEYR